MNKLQTTILTSGFIILAMSVLPVFSVSAIAIPSTNLTVGFEQSPLFSEANFLPGQAITRYVDVTNNTSESKIIGVEAKNYTSCSTDCLADQLKLKITDGINTLYGEVSLTEFFAAGEKKLSELSAGGTTKYYFTITFLPESGNQYQNNQVGFDFDIGIFGQETIGGGGDTGGGGGGGGGGSSGGGGGAFGGDTGLIITNENAAPVVSNQTDITWETNHPATSRVIYSAETESHAFQLENPPNYGYAHSTAEDTTLKISHAMNISGLVPGVTYYYRVVSHGSFAVSTEHSFTVPAVKGVQTESGGAIVSTQGATGAGGGVGKAEGVKENGNENVITQEQTEEDFTNNFLAALGGLFSKIDFCSVFFLLIVIIIILLLLPLIEKKEDEDKKWIVSIIAIIILVIIYTLICPYYKILLLVVAILLISLLFYRYIRGQKK